MNGEHKCPNCFMGSIASGKCPVCGFERKEEKQNRMRLPEMLCLQNRYMLGRVLGCGGFGITYKAFDILNQCYCTVKEFIPVGIVTREEDSIQIQVTSNACLDDFEHGKKRFMEEAEVLKKLIDVPEVVRITDYFMQNNTAYFVMEYIDGITLKQLMHVYGRKIPFKDAWPVVCHVGKALDQVHRRAGIFHRDISPDNIMVNQNGRVKLIDFGNAKYIIGKKSQTLSVILKHGYAPPEQYSSTSNQGSYTDVYALAATFYYIVTGVMVPNAPDRFSGEGYRPLKELEPVVPGALSDAVDRALVLNSRQRIQTVAEFVNVLPVVDEQRKMPYLRLAGNAGGHLWNFPENTIILVGRSNEQADIVPTKNGMISKIHCELFFDSIEKSFYLVDHSTNGTYVGGKKLEKGKVYLLRNGERFSLGKNICDLEVGWKNG